MSVSASPSSGSARPGWSVWVVSRLVSPWLGHFLVPISCGCLLAIDLGCHLFPGPVSFMRRWFVVVSPSIDCWHTLVDVLLPACTPAADGLGVTLVAPAAGHNHVLVLRWTQPLCCTPHCCHSFLLFLLSASCCRPGPWLCAAGLRRFLLLFISLSLVLSCLRILIFVALVSGATLTPIQYGGVLTLAVHRVLEKVWVGAAACQ